MALSFALVVETDTLVAPMDAGLSQLIDAEAKGSLRYLSIGMALPVGDNAAMMSLSSSTPLGHVVFISSWLQLGVRLFWQLELVQLFLDYPWYWFEFEAPSLQYLMLHITECKHMHGHILW